jgi:small ligand-binding sensory domain FIST
MRWTSAIRAEPSARKGAARSAEGTAAAHALATSARDGLGDRADLALVFASGHHAAGFPRLVEDLRRELPGAVLVACTASGVIGGGRELEGASAVSLVAARLPGTRVLPFALDRQLAPSPEELRGALEVERGRAPAALLLLADPFSFHAEAWLESLHAAFPGCPAIGGLASGGAQPGDHVLCAGERVVRGGIAGAALYGALALDTVVAQGCRPIGAPLFVTRARDNLVLELDGRSPLALLRELFESAAPEDKPLFRGSLFVGLEMREGRSQYRRGDFLVRNIAGIDAQSGAIAVAAPVREHQILQFQLRDRRTSAEDLDDCLERYRRSQDPAAVRGALLFSCVGRGAGLYGEPDHDSLAFKRALGDVPLGGFFGNGELGPVDGRTYLHAYTSAFGLFRALD